MISRRFYLHSLPEQVKQHVALNCLNTLRRPFAKTFTLQKIELSSFRLLISNRDYNRTHSMISHNNDTQFQVLLSLQTNVLQLRNHINVKINPLVIS